MANILSYSVCVTPKVNIRKRSTLVHNQKQSAGALKRALHLQSTLAMHNPYLVSLNRSHTRRLTGGLRVCRGAAAINTIRVRSGVRAAKFYDVY